MVKKGKILIIDDEIDFNRLLAKIVQISGYESFCYYQGESAVDTTRKTRPDLILLDINLPDVSGLEVYQRLKTNEETGQIPIVFVSALHDQENYCLYVLHAQGFIKKSSGARVILNTIDKTLSGSMQALN